MAGGLSKQDQALDRGARMVADARGELDQQLSSLRGQLAGIGTSWIGSGSTAFQGVMSRWDDDTRRIIAALDGFEVNLRASDATYDSSDEQQAATYTSLASRLG